MQATRSVIQYIRNIKSPKTDEKKTYFQRISRLISRFGNRNLLKAKKLKDYKRIKPKGIIFSVSFVA